MPTTTRPVRVPVIQLLHGDCLEQMAELPDQCVDAIITDVPFGVTSIGWDAVIPLDAMWQALRRLIKPRGAIALFGVQPFTAKLICSNLEEYRYTWIWQKNVAGGFAQAKNKPMSMHEEISVFSSGKTGHVGQCKNRMPYYPQGLIPYGKETRNTLTDRQSAFGARPSHKKSYVQEFTGYPNTVLQFDVERDGIHPTQKPVPLMQYLINTYTQRGGVVLDFTMGSGTTGVAAMRTGRRFIGIERDEGYFKTASDRIYAARKEALQNAEQPPAEV